ncbi:serine hydrolase [Streptomyces sp. V2I9]|uniref:serine hydrolase domain-containing protein n=1 Tax=Streptomyces sp. V2I9 TaxID=3042304 RepID=UPI0027835E3D|nr:serine hydrolase domain-containing protein [Streptomyces sp. V2I9]MDQ0988224.1 CubicO group peptidase (beta-lactamase class C family) [Streptomyces sp. V2I9]
MARTDGADGFDPAVLEEAVSRTAEAGQFSGTVRVTRGGEPLLTRAFGSASRRWSVPNTPDTRFRVASVAKAFTAVAVLQLVERGRIRLDDALVDHVGGHMPRLDPRVTVLHALTMTSGIGDWFEEGGENGEEEWAALTASHPLYLLRGNADYVPLFADKKPHFPPGERHLYNGAGYILLGLLLETVTGRSFEDTVTDEVFTPAGMNTAGFVALDELGPGVAEGYLTAADGPTPYRTNHYATTPRAAADGGSTCSAADLTSFARALRHGRLLDEETTRLALTPQVAEREEKVRGYRWMYGFGLTHLLDDEGNTVRWGHTGEEDGVSARLYHYPRHDMDVAVLANVSWSAGDMGWAVHDAIVGT